MKNIAIKSLGWIGLLIFSLGVAIAQEEPAHIVHYAADPGQKKPDTKRPDFSKSVVAIDFGGQAAVEAKNLFIGLGVQNFLEGNNPCKFNGPIICVQITHGDTGQIASYGSSYGSNGRGSFISGGTFSGTETSIGISVVLVLYDKDTDFRTRVMLGQAWGQIYAGSGSDYTYSSGKNSSGGYQTNYANDVNAPREGVVIQSLSNLLGQGVGHAWSAFGANHKWVRGADVQVKNAFKG